MKFLHLRLFHKEEVEFGNIEVYDDIKDLVRRLLDSNENYNLLCGPPASAKTIFLLGILECRKGVYFDGSNTTNRILDVLEEERPRVICIDELDKMSRQFQNQLLNFLESRRIKVGQQRRFCDFEIKGAKVSVCWYPDSVPKPRPQIIKSKAKPKVQTYNTLESRLKRDDFSDPLVKIENLLPAPGLQKVVSTSPESQPTLMLYFCVPKNDKLLSYWDSSHPVFCFLHAANNSQVEYGQRILTGIVAYAIIVYQYIHNLSNNFSSCCEASDIY
jgi:hypothetical protein